MKILALETSADTLSVSLCEDKKIIASFTGNLKRTHSGTLLPIINSLLQYSELTVDNIDIFALAVGPGSFTGLRIGVATVKGLAFGKDTPAIGVSSLEAMAYNFSNYEGKLICPSINARRNEVYYAVFRIVNGVPERITEDSSAPASVLEEMLLDMHEDVMFCGDGTDVLRRVFTTLKLPTDNQLLLYPNASSVAFAAYDEYKKNGAHSSSELSPVYLKPSQAERERIEKLGKQ